METKSGKSLNLPLTADAERGGFPGEHNAGYI